MKNALLKALADGKGRLVSGAAGFIVAMIVRWLSSISFTLSETDLNYLTGLVLALVGWGIDAIFIRLQTAGVKEIQDALPPSVRSDGVAGEKTIAAVEKAVDQANGQP